MSIRSHVEHGLLAEFGIWHSIIKNMNNFLQNCREASASMPLTSMMMMLNDAHKHGLPLKWLPLSHLPLSVWHWMMKSYQVSVILKKPLCECTACCWLHKLGYCKDKIQKGVYMDGHEHTDVVEYQNNTFLPIMNEYQSWMTHYKGPDLVPHPPNLKPGERRIICLYHNECVFSANDFQSTVWYALILSSTRSLMW